MKHISWWIIQHSHQGEKGNCYCHHLQSSCLKMVGLNRKEFFWKKNRAKYESTNSCWEEKRFLQKSVSLHFNVLFPKNWLRDSKSNKQRELIRVNDLQMFFFIKVIDLGQVMSHSIATDHENNSVQSRNCTQGDCRSIRSINNPTIKISYIW